MAISAINDASRHCTELKAAPPVATVTRPIHLNQMSEAPSVHYRTANHSVIFAGPHFDVTPARMLSAQQPQCAPTRHMTVESHLAWDAWSVRRERLAKECLCGRNSTVAAEQEIDGLAMLVDRAVKVVPLRSDGDVCLIDSPRRANGSRESVPALLELRNVTSDPPKDRRMRDFDAALGHHLHKISIRQPISDVSAHAQLDDVGVEYAFTVHRVTRDRLRHSAPRANKIRQSIRCPWMHQNP